MGNFEFKITTETILYSIPLELAEKLIAGESNEGNKIKYSEFFEFIREFDLNGKKAQQVFEVLDNVYRIIFLKLLTQKKDLEELEDYRNHLARVSNKVQGTIFDSSGIAYSTYWMIYKGFIEDRIESYDNDNLDKVISMNHVFNIMQLVNQEGEIKQGKIMDEIPAIRKKANLSRILNVMERNSIIEKRKSGSQNFISLGINAPKDSEFYKTDNVVSSFAEDEEFNEFKKDRTNVLSITQRPILEEHHKEASAT